MHQPKTRAIIHNEVTCAPNQRQKHLVLHGFSGPCSVEPTRRGGGTPWRRRKRDGLFMRSSRAVWRNIFINRAQVFAFRQSELRMFEPEQPTGRREITAQRGLCRSRVVLCVPTPSREWPKSSNPPSSKGPFASSPLGHRLQTLRPHQALASVCLQRTRVSERPRRQAGQRNTARKRTH